MSSSTEPVQSLAAELAQIFLQKSLYQLQLNGNKNTIPLESLASHNGVPGTFSVDIILPSIFNQIFTSFWFVMKQELLDKPEKLFSLKNFQNPTVLISACYSVIVRFKFSGEWTSS